MNIGKKYKHGDMICIAVLLCALLLSLGLIWHFTGMSPFLSNSYNSYTVQALSWLEGRLDVDYRSWLELAEYEGKYYISFPPLPSLIMLPFAAVFGENTPDHLINLFFAFVTAVYAYKLARHFGKDEKNALFWSLFLTCGSNFLFIASLGWVWFMAQNMAFAFLMLSFYCAAKPDRGRGALSLIFVALAVCCRPLDLAFIPGIMYILYKNCGSGSPVKGITKKWYYLIAPALIACALFAFNYIRFGSIFEFGHNYLPEFVNSPEGQFSLSYVPYNLFRCIRLFAWNGSKLSVPTFDGWCVFIVVPMLISIVSKGISTFIKERHACVEGIIVVFGIAVNILMLCAHKTMGGWHFGNRYLIDFMPAVYYLYMKNSRVKCTAAYDVFLLIFGMLINIGGTIAFYNGWI
ncbi:MAG: hypothetical protein E7334_06575 [Clostridiales bacterium]|nr:hypothetical protein [Clostridiales bacterium]